MKTTLKALFFIFFLVSISVVNGQEWQQYDFPEGKSSIKFPGTPKYHLVDKEEFATHKYELKQDQRNYLFTFTIHQNTITDHYSLAETGLESFLKIIQGDVLKNKDFKYKKHKGKQAVIMKDDAIIVYEIILIGQIQYQMVFFTSGEQKKSFKYGRKFLKSFEVTK